MKKLAEFQDFNELWRNHVEQSESLRMHDDQVEQDFWKRFMGKKTGYVQDPSARQVSERFLLPQIRKKHIDTVLEWGPGWGNYTIDLLRACSRVDCLDISADVLSFITKIAADQGCQKPNTILSKWEDFRPERKYDLVFGYNCFYRQANLAACMKKMNDSAEKLCVAGMTTGLAPVWTRELEQSGMPVDWEWKDYPYFAGVLYQMGIYANVTVLPYEKTFTYPDEEALLRGECDQWAQIPVQREKALEILLRYFTRQEDGSLQAKAQYHCGIVWWTPV